MIATSVADTPSKPVVSQAFFTTETPYQIGANGPMFRGKPTGDAWHNLAVQDMENIVSWLNNAYKFGHRDGSAAVFDSQARMREAI